MKLLRYGPVGKEKPGLLDAQGRIRNLSGEIGDLEGAALASRAMAKIARLKPDALPLVKGRPRIGPCISGVRHFIAVGLNYSDHAAEMGAPIPAEPILFNKAPNCIVGAYDPVMLPKGSVKTDWEAELAIVIGDGGSHIAKKDALKAVAGFCICNDVSERAFQAERGGQWMKGKSSPSFGPLGPWLVTPDEIAHVQKLDIWLDVNGVRRQTGSTWTMIFSVVELIAYISQFMRLDPGDIITTGTPPGVGAGMKPPQFLKAGDVMALGITGLGEQRQSVVAWKA